MMWDSDALWKKAVLYTERANQFRHETTDFPLWSALALEFLARAALTKVHPTLNADPRGDTSLLYACGFAVPDQPKSLPLHAVFLRLEKIIPAYGKVQRVACDHLTLLRNEELHAAGLPFETLKESKWLPRYYEVCQILCEHLGKKLRDLVGVQLEPSAETLIKALNTDVENAVKGRIAQFAKAFAAKSPEERSSSVEVAQQNSRFLGNGFAAHTCPACGCQGVLDGDKIKELAPHYEDEQLLVFEEFLAVAFHCAGCGLPLRSPEELAHAGIEPRFAGKRITDLHELFQPEEQDPYMDM